MKYLAFHFRDNKSKNMDGNDNGNLSCCNSSTGHLMAGGWSLGTNSRKSHRMTVSPSMNPWPCSFSGPIPAPPIMLSLPSTTASLASELSLAPSRHAPPQGLNTDSLSTKSLPVAPLLHVSNLNCNSSYLS